MAWKVELAQTALTDLKRLDREAVSEILSFLSDRVVKRENPREVGITLQHGMISWFWKYRVGDYRVICDIQDEDEEVLVLMVEIGHGKNIYD